MQNLCNKVIAIVVVAILLGCNCMTSAIYAAEIIEQNISTSEENITFNATIGNAESHGGYEYTADIDSEDTGLYLSIDVKNAGYLKDIVINLENNNYKIDTSKVQDEQVKNVTDTTIELNQIGTGKSANIVLPIYLDKKDIIAGDELSRDSKVKLTATYINQSNKERKIEKELVEHLNWTVKEDSLSGTVDQRVIRYLSYNGKTMVSFLLSDVLNEHKLPISSKEIAISVPTLRDVKPSKVMVTAIQTANTNGKTDGVEFGEDNFQYDEKTGMIIINMQNTPDEQGNISWNKELEDKFIITYIYDINTNEEAITINSKVASKTTLVNNMNVNSMQEQTEFNLDSKIGDIVTVDITCEQDNINKGYMYSNKDKAEDKLETEFTLNYGLNIGLVEALDKVNLTEVGSYFNEEDASDYIYNKKVSVSKEELIKVLGEEGEIKVLNSEGAVLGTLNKDTLELDLSESKLTFETSKPQVEGTISLKLNKAIKGELNYTRDQIESFTKLTSRVQINQVVDKEITLEEPTSKATLDISNTNLSTVVKNEDVIMTATLERNDITDNLYKNPELYIQLPEEVKEINIKDAQLLYDDELVSKSSTIEGNTIKLELDGTQSKYSSQSTSNGSVVRIVADLTLDNLTPSKETNVLLGYKNENDVASVASENNGVNVVAAPLNIVAPTGFVTTNTMSGYNGDEIVTSIEGSEAIGKLPTLANKEVTVTGVAVNNLGADAEGFRILGRTPFKGNKQVDGSIDLGTTVDTELVDDINVEGIDATVYYSTNPDATIVLPTDRTQEEMDSDEEYIDTNQWMPYFMADAKSFLIVANTAVPTASTVRFSYNVRTRYVEYANTIKATFGVYYDNGAEEGNTKDVVLATPVGVKTQDVPKMDVIISLRDMFSGTEIPNRGNVRENQYLTYNISVTNTGEEDALNAKATIDLPDAFGLVTIIDNGVEGYKEYTTSHITPHVIDLGTVKAGETKNCALNLQVVGDLIEGSEERILRATITADNVEEETVQLFTANLQTGLMDGMLQSTYEGRNVEVGQEINYALLIKNPTKAERTNVVAKLILPEGIEYISTFADEYYGGTEVKYEGSYNKNTNEVTFNIGTLGASQWETIFIKTKTTDKANGTLKTKAVITFNESTEPFTTNETTIYCGVQREKVKATLSSNIEGQLLDTDILEYYIDLTNITDITTSVNVKSMIPSELAPISYKVEVAGNVTSNKSNYTASQFAEIVQLAKNQSARITVVAKPYNLPTGQRKEITNTPEVSILGETAYGEPKKVNINSLTHTIIGTGNSGGMEGAYKISGTAWLDSNKDGKKDINETKLANIKFTLYTQKGTIAKDSTGKDAVATSDENGKYTFNNLNSGTYLVVAEYDTTEYIATTYKASGISESENADFFDAKLGDLTVAATDIITIGNSNIYNLDLGLKEREKFDLKLEKTVKKVTVTNTKLDPRVYEFDKNFVQIPLYNTYVEYSTVLIEYSIKVTNNGRIAGYAKELVDYLPEGMAFSSDLNNNWYIGRDGNAYTTALANTLIKPGETKTVNLVLTRKMTGENVGLVHNVAEITKDYNDQGIKDGNSTPGNKKDGEDDMSYADTLLSMSTGNEIASFIGITIGILTIVVLAVYLIKKYVISKI